MSPGVFQLHKAICLCLSKMAADSNIRYVMLEKACLDGDAVLAECLIDLGADVNRKTKTESLIYQVRKQETRLLIGSGRGYQYVWCFMCLTGKKKCMCMVL